MVFEEVQAEEFKPKADALAISKMLQTILEDKIHGLTDTVAPYGRLRAEYSFLLVAILLSEISKGSVSSPNNSHLPCT